MRSGSLGITVMFAVLAVGCGRDYQAVDKEPDGTEMRFDGIRDLLANPNNELHILQTHGMGDHPHGTFCEKDRENVQLRNEIVRRLGYHPVGLAPKAVSIVVGKSNMGSYSTRVYVDNLQRPTKTLYFSCLSWGEASREIKLSLLELDKDTFLETNDHEARRAKFNRDGKTFVNRSFSDPLIYAGPFGRYIRAAAWKGIDQIDRAQRENRNKHLSLKSGLESDGFLDTVPTVVISDSLGSRVMFDVLWTFDPPSGSDDNYKLLAPGATALEIQRRRDIRGHIGTMFMLANQLPLLALANFEPDDNLTLKESLARQVCYIPKDELREMEDDQPKDKPKTIVAMTDVNDLLSYNLSEKFKSQCAPPGSGLRIVNVTLTNASPRFGLFAHPVKAHASGFKDNPDAIEYMVEGNN